MSNEREERPKESNVGIAIVVATAFCFGVGALKDAFMPSAAKNSAATITAPACDKTSQPACK